MKTKITRMRGLLGALALCWTAAAVADAAPSEWEVIGKRSGMTVSVRPRPGHELPTFRGQGTIKGNVLNVFDAVLDVNAAKEWAVNVDEVAVLRQIDARTHLVYVRLDSPWPVSDRDMVVKRVVDVVSPGREFHQRLECVPGGRAERKGVIRVIDCISDFTLRYADAEHTSIDYKSDMDPRGSLPDWIVIWAGKRIPLDTLERLENYVLSAPKYKSARH